MGKTHIAADNTKQEPHAAPRPWRLVVDEKGGKVRAMQVVAANGAIVEHRLALGFTPEAFARHIANARHYVAAVNQVEKKGG